MSKFFLVLSALTFYVGSLCVFQTSADTICDPRDPTPKITIPTNIVTLHSASLQEYVVSRKLEKNESFVIKCTSSHLVDWRFKGIIGNSVVKSERSVTNFLLFTNGTSPGTCYQSALIFKSVENEITGQYFCLVNPDLSLSPWTKNSFRSASDRSLKKITLFSGLSQLMFSNKEFTYNLDWLRIIKKNQNYDEELYDYDLPCVRNHPDANLTVFYKNEKNSEWIPVANFDESRGVSITVRLTKNNLPRIYKCEAGSDSHLSPENVIINILQYPIAVFWPPVPHPETVFMHTETFYCISRVPINIFKADDLLTELKVTTGKFVNHFMNMGFKGTKAVQIDVSKYRRKLISSIIGEIVCQDSETNGTIVNYNWTYQINAELSQLKQNRRGFLNGESKTAECLTSTLSTVGDHIEYIIANNHVELSLQQNCLTNPYRDWNFCPISNNSLPTQRSKSITVPMIVYADLPPNKAGAFNCKIPDLHNQNGNFYDVLSPTVHKEMGNFGNSWQDYIKLTSFYKYLINLGETVQVQCESSQMYFHGLPHWVVIWHNNTCSSVPEMWIKDDNITKENAFHIRKSQIEINNIEVKGITCGAIPIAWNVKNTKSQGGCVHTMLIHPDHNYIFSIKEKKTNSLALTEIIIASTCTTIAFILIVTTTGVWWARRNLVSRRDVVFESIVKKFFDGFEADAFEENVLVGVAECKPYDKSFEVKMENVKIEWETSLGSGEFGVVLKGNLYDNAASKKETAVAVKTVKTNASTEVLNGLMSELKVMIYIGKHPNIVCLMGSVTEKLVKREMYLLLEYCENGSLFKYLKDNRPAFVNNSVEAFISSDSPSSNIHNNLNNPQYAFSRVNLFRWSRQIVSGMDYLTQKKVIHGDLATRNVLLDNTRNAKLSDFGLSRRLYEKYEYVKKTNDPLPWRWMAIESLRDRTFSAESDVWSFGVTFWEILSLALTPFPSDRYTNEFITLIESGHRLPKPQYASDELYKVMNRCWEVDPAKRPLFSDLSQILDEIFNKNYVNDKFSHEILYSVIYE